MELTNQEKQAKFTEIKSSVSKKMWPEFGRKLGLSDSIIESYEESTDSKHEMLTRWTMHCGLFTEQKARLLDLVRKEVFDSERHREVDAGLPTDLALVRDRAFVMYDIVQHYHSNDMWEDIARKKLNVPERVISDIGSDNNRSNAEKKYQMLRHWVSRHNYKTTIEIAQALRRLELEVPEEYLEADGPTVDLT